MADPVQLRTERLIVRQGKPGDALAVVDFVARNRAFHAPHDPIRDESYFTEPYWQERLTTAIDDFAAGRNLELFVFRHDAPTFVIGRIQFSGFVRGAFQACYLGYVLDQEAQGSGYMTEALRVAIDYMFTDQNFHRIMANYMPSNARSAAVLERLGFEREGLARNYLRIAGKWEDHVLTSLSNPGWREE